MTSFATVAPQGLCMASERVSFRPISSHPIYENTLLQRFVQGAEVRNVSIQPVT